MNFLESQELKAQKFHQMADYFDYKARESREKARACEEAVAGIRKAVDDFCGEGMSV